MPVLDVMVVGACFTLKSFFPAAPCIVGVLAVPGYGRGPHTPLLPPAIISLLKFGDHPKHCVLFGVCFPASTMSRGHIRSDTKLAVVLLLEAGMGTSSWPRAF